MRTRPAFLAPFLLVAAFSSPETDAADMPGHESAVMAVLEDRRMAWVNPARISAPGQAGLDLGFSLTSPVMEYIARLHFPLGLSFAYEGSGVEWADPSFGPGYYGNGVVSNIFHTFALAKSGFGPSPWLAGLGLGVATRYFYELEQPFSWYQEEEVRLPNVWSLEAGMTWKLPEFGPWGNLTVGMFSLQTSTRLAADRMEGAQARWMDASGLWDLSGNLILDYPQYRREMETHLPLQSRHGTHTLALTFHPGRWDLGAVAFPTYRLAGTKVRWKPETQTLLRRLSLGLELYAGEGFWSRQFPLFPAGGFSIEAEFRTPKDESVARNYRDYRRNRAEDYPGREPAKGTAEPPAQASSAPDQVPLAQEPMNKEQWRQSLESFEKERIGTFRGVVWPYVNTFGYFTTLAVPAGTSSLAVGEYVPGLAMLLVWCGLVTAVALETEEFGPMSQTYLVAQPFMKLVDLYLARRHVKRHNRALKEKYRLSLQPRKDGVGALASLAF